MTADPSRSIEFFDEQFARQIASRDYRLNPFETRILPYLHGTVLDLGCGLGNLSIAAAMQGAVVTAKDTNANAVADLSARARKAGLPISAHQADLRGWEPEGAYDAVACIGLLMFFERSFAHRGLNAVCRAVKPGGIAAVNVLVEGTTYTAMFDPTGYHLFSREELMRPFLSWHVLDLAAEDFPAPNDTIKRFLTLIARRPA